MTLLTPLLFTIPIDRHNHADYDPPLALQLLPLEQSAT
jgi:hypothetical protein